MSNLLNKATLVMIPSGVKAGKLYSVIPESGAGDFDISRNSLANRINSQDAIQSEAIDVSRLQYGNGCPTYLQEPARTNLFLNSRTPVTQTVTVASGTTYTVSGSGVGSVVLSDAGTGTVTTGNDVTFTASSTSLVCTVTDMDWVQVEAGSFSTMIIDTLGASETRVIEYCLGGIDASLYNSAEGVLFVEAAVFKGDTSERYITLMSGSSTDRVYMRWTPVNNQIRFVVFSGGVSLDYTATLADTSLMNKLAIKYKLNDFAVWINGIEVHTDDTGDIPATPLDQIRFTSNTGTNRFHGNCQKLYYFPVALTDEELQQLTT